MTEQNTQSDIAAYAQAFVNLASPRFGTEVVFATDDFFAAKERMIADHAPVWKQDVYDNNGKWMDGWESRRRRDGGKDHALIRLGGKGIVRAVNIDTSYFTGNFPPAASLEACLCDGEPDENTEWVEILAPLTLGPSAEHYARIAYDMPVNWVRVTMFPDGGIARLRLYGEPYQNWSDVDDSASLELSALKNGGRVVGYNNAHYGDTWALLAEGRGKDMGDGWETRRRREPGNDWIIVELGHAGVVDALEIDTAHFKGNFPESFSIDAAYIEKGTDKSIVTQSMFWKELVPRQTLSADNIHRIKARDILDFGPVSHVKLNIYPDGGVSRLRVFGRPSKAKLSND